MSDDERRRVPVPDVLPVLPMRDAVVFPEMAAPVLVGQPRSLELVDDLRGDPKLVAVVAQRDPDRVPARPEDLYTIATMAAVHELARMENAVRLVLQGLERIRIVDYASTHPYLVARVVRAPEPHEGGVELEGLARTARELFVRLVRAADELSGDLAVAAEAATEPRQLAYLIASTVPLPTATRQEVFAIDPVSGRLRRLVDLMQHELAVRQVVQRVTRETAEEVSKAQREQILRKHMESIQRELGEVDSGRAEARELREKVASMPLSEEARKEAAREIERLERTPDVSPEYGMIRTYLDWLLKMPWGKRAGGRIDVQRARAVLDEDHFDLEKVKSRIVDYLAVKRLRDERAKELEGRDVRGEPILCFVGPPGVGKTSLGQSIARAMGRPFVRQSLGGIHDEAEIRGHRRTYIGAMPGRVAQALARAEAADPVFMLDEVDKLGTGFHGDPAAALLELLDPAQNHAFVDTYLGVPFDLSGVLFICTANTTETVPPPLLDRMEVIALAGYTEQEKLHIARRFLIPRERLANGLREGEVVVGDDAVVEIVRGYTREAGVRNLEREIATVLRKAARRITEGAAVPIRVEAGHLRESLGPRRFYDEVAERIDRPGVATGMSWTPAGGEILFVEATMVPSDEDRLVLTGMLGNVMRESAEAALTYLRSNAERLGLGARVGQRELVHVHVPAGAIPKDGPSAGVTILVALASFALGRPIRGDLAMTGEITLRGKVLPVGGVKEKVLAAYRAGLRTVILPRRNEADLEEIPEEVRRACRFVPVESADDALREALGVQPAEPAERDRVDGSDRAAAPPPTH